MSSYGGDGEESWEVVHPLNIFSPVYDDGGLEIESGGLIDTNYFPHPEQIPRPSYAEEKVEKEESVSSVRSSPEWIDPGTPQDLEGESVDESRASEEEGFVLEEVEGRVLEGLGDLESGPDETYCKISEWWRLEGHLTVNCAFPLLWNSHMENVDGGWNSSHLCDTTTPSNT